MNWKTGLFRVWAVGAVIWIVVAAIASDAPRNLNYAYTYHFHYSTLATKENAQSPCYFLNKYAGVFEEMERRRLRSSLTAGAAENPDTYARAKRQADALGVSPSAIVPELKEIEERAKITGNDALLETAPGTATFISIPENAKLAHDRQSCIANFKPSPPEWEWLAPVLLPPTLGVVAAGLLLWIVFVVARWIWRGFRLG